MYGFIWFTEQTLITALNIMNTMNLYDKDVVCNLGDENQLL